MKRYALPLVILLQGCGDSASPTSSSFVPTTRSQDSAQAAVADVPFRRILCFGDSITYGVTLMLPPGAHGDLALVEGYVPKLWRRLEEKYGDGFELINAGVPGETTSEGRDRLRLELATHDPDLVLLLQGVVDVNDSSPRFPVVRQNLADMMRMVSREGKLVIVGTYLPMNPDGFRGSYPANLIRLNEIIRQEARGQNVIVADHEKASSDLSGQGPDGLHPNNAGYETMADTWLAAIEELAELLGET